jgi:hypothetical protein
MIINGVAYWASLQTPNTKFEPCWCITVEVDAATSTTLQEAGLKPKMVDGKARYQFKRLTIDKKTNSPNPRPPQLNVDGVPFADNVGNGSLVTIQAFIKPWKWNGKSGVKSELQGVKVMELVPFGEVKPDDGSELGMAPPASPTDDELFSE